MCGIRRQKAGDRQRQRRQRCCHTPVLALSLVFHNARAARIASGQLGLIASRQARSAGMTDDEIESMVRRGGWERRHAATFAVAGAPRSWRQDLLAACLAVNGSVMASHRAAAQLWGLVENLDVVEITVPRGRRLASPGVIVHRPRDVRAQDLSTRQAIPVTNPLRTIVDLGAVAPQAVPRAIDVATTRRLVTVSGLRVVTEEVGRQGREGVGVVRAVLADRGVGKDASVLEAAFRRALRRRHVALPEPQFEVRDNGRFVARVDYADVELRLAWELLGYEFHSSYEALQADEARRQRLNRVGWEVHGLFWHQVLGAPESVADEVVEARQRRALAILGTKTR
jgi:very-short-patch-repair endonuclease